MGIFDFLRNKPKNSAQVARERLRIIVAQERSDQNGPDYLPLMRKEILEVIHKYVHVEPEDVHINVDKTDGEDLFELSVTLPGQ